MSILSRSLIIFAVCASSAQAAPITLYGDTVSFTYDDIALGLYGTPTVSGDNLLFSNLGNFKTQAFSSGSLAFNNTSSSTAITITSLSGKGDIVSSVSLEERGIYNSLNVIGATPSSTSVAVAGSITAIDIATQAELSGQINTTTAFTTTPASFQTKTWNASSALALNSLNSESIIFSLTNNLIALSRYEGDLSSIEKNFVAIHVATSPVPLPAAVWMFGAALFGFLSMSKRKHQL